MLGTPQVLEGQGNVSCADRNVDERCRDGVGEIISS